MVCVRIRERVCMFILLSPYEVEWSGTTTPQLQSHVPSLLEGRCSHNNLRHQISALIVES